MTRCGCGWPLFHAGKSLRVVCPQCKAELHVGDDSAPPIVARDISQCRHRDPNTAIQMDCQCGNAYQCLKLKKLCSYSRPIDQFVYAGDTQLTDENFQWCGSCGSFAGQDDPQGDVGQQSEAKEPRGSGESESHRH